MRSIPLTVLSQNPSFPYSNAWNGKNDILLSVSNLCKKQSSPASNSVAILSQIVLHRDELILRLSLYCLRKIRLGISNLYYCIFSNSNDPLSTPIASDVILHATISRPENLVTTHLLGIFPDSFTKLPATFLHMYRTFGEYRL